MRADLTRAKSQDYRATDTHVGRRVKSRRMQLGLSQSDLADKCGITFQQIQKYEKGTNRIGSSRLQQIADALQVTPPYFFEDPLAETPHLGQDVKIAQVNEFLSSRDGIDLMRAFVKVKSKSLRRMIVEIVDELAK